MISIAGTLSAGTDLPTSGAISASSVSARCTSPMIGGAQNRFADGKLTDEATGKLLADLGTSLVLAVRHARAAAQHVK